MKIIIENIINTISKTEIVSLLSIPPSFKAIYNDPIVIIKYIITYKTVIFLSFLIEDIMKRPRQK